MYQSSSFVVRSTKQSKMFKLLKLVLFAINLSVAKLQGCEYFCECDNKYIYCRDLPFLPPFQNAAVILEFTFVNSHFEVFSIDKEEYPALRKITFINCQVWCEDLNELEEITVEINNNCIDKTLTSRQPSSTQKMGTTTQSSKTTSMLKTSMTSSTGYFNGTTTQPKSGSSGVPIIVHTQKTESSHIALGVVAGLLFVAITALIVVSVVKARRPNHDDNNDLIEDNRIHRPRNRDHYPMAHSAAVVGIENAGYDAYDDNDL